MGVGENFQEFRKCYMLDKTTMDSIAYRYQRITRQLNESFWNTSSETAHSLYVGSYGRDTAAKGVSDLDIYFQLPVALYEKYDQYRGNGQSVLLQAVRASMQKTYSLTDVKGDGQVVIVSFTDGITFEVLPGFANTAGGVTFADSNDGGTWKTCNPRAEMEAFAKRNAEANHNLKALGRMMRIWKDQNRVPISGMLIDTLAYNFIDGWSHKDKSYFYHDYLVRDFLDYLSVMDRTQDWWKAPGSGSWVRRSGIFEFKAKAGYEIAVAAIGHENGGRPSTARNKWRELFGTTYP